MSGAPRWFGLWRARARAGRRRRRGAVRPGGARPQPGERRHVALSLGRSLVGQLLPALVLLPRGRAAHPFRGARGLWRARPRSRLVPRLVRHPAPALRRSRRLRPVDAPAASPWLSPGLSSVPARNLRRRPPLRRDGLLLLPGAKVTVSASVSRPRRVPPLGRLA